MRGLINFLFVFLSLYCCLTLFPLEKAFYIIMHTQIFSIRRLRPTILSRIETPFHSLPLQSKRQHARQSRIEKYTAKLTYSLRQFDSSSKQGSSLHAMFNKRSLDRLVSSSSFGEHTLQLPFFTLSLPSSRAFCDSPGCMLLEDMYCWIWRSIHMRTRTLICYT